MEKRSNFSSFPQYFYLLIDFHVENSDFQSRLQVSCSTFIWMGKVKILIKVNEYTWIICCHVFTRGATFMTSVCFSVYHSPSENGSTL